MHWLWIELGDDVIRLHYIADIHPPADHASIDTEREVLLGSGMDVAGERYRFSIRAGHGGDRSDRPDFRRRLRLIASSQQG
jgi:hypothetical protein